MFEKLRAFVGDNAEALALIDTIEGTSNENVQKINDLETTVEAVKQTRDQYKAGNALVKQVLGVDQVNEDTIKEAIKALKGGKGDDANKAEIDNLKKLLKETADERDNLKKDYEGKLQSMALDNALANAGLGANVANEAMYGIVADLVKKGAVLDGDQIVYKNEDGSTIYGDDKQPLNIQTKMDQLKNDPSYAGLFKVDVVAGSGTPPRQGGANITADTKEMSPSQKMAAGRAQAN